MVLIIGSLGRKSIFLQRKDQAYLMHRIIWITSPSGAKGKQLPTIKI
jgi:hypothetical protein